MRQLAPPDLAEWLADGKRPAPSLVDVREPWELSICSIAGSRPIPMRSIPERAGELPQEEPIVVVCHHGVRSLQVALYLSRLGFSQVYNLQGGIAAWADQVEPAMARY